ncbi:MAG: CobW family GTP-binding protein, partial [Pseudanabaena sp.]
DPAPVIQTFFVDEDVSTKTKLDAVVTVVDAKHISQHWDAEEVQEQIAFADIILLNKTDLVSEAELEDLEKRIKAMNLMSKIYRTQNSEIDMDAVLGVGAFELERALQIDPEFLGEDAHEHDDTVKSVAIVEEGELYLPKVNDWISTLLREQGVDIFRMKGILNIKGIDERFVFQGVHMLFDGTRDRQWQPNEPRQNELVFIGRNLDTAKLKADFLACR